jgi:hypothetical protein
VHSPDKTPPGTLTPAGSVSSKDGHRGFQDTFVSKRRASAPSCFQSLVIVLRPGWLYSESHPGGMYRVEAGEEA